MRIVIDLSPRGKSNLVLAGAFALLAAMALPADASITNFNAGDPLSAATMNANFSDLNGRVTQLQTGRVVATINSKSFSIGATIYKGVTSTSYTGSQVNGYSGAKTLCETAIASPSAHMCSSDEVGRSVQSGLALQSGWYETATYAYVPTLDVFDCSGWTSTTADAAWWNGHPSADACATAHPLLCCD
jgi:hypothetical protein